MIKSFISDLTCPLHPAPANNQDYEAMFKGRIPGWRVIDCATNIIVNLRDCITASGSFAMIEYATLSYVWGIGPIDSLTADGRLPDRLPRVIEDALGVARSLGFRYLWIDRYCIPQHDTKGKQGQIRNMDLIYSRSCLTIIAAAGDGPEHGLPGVGQTERKLCPNYRLGSHLLMQYNMTHLWAAEQIRSSKWNSRAWTCQEAALSSRRLYFTDYFALFETGGTEGPWNCRADGIPDFFVPQYGNICDKGGGGVDCASSYMGRELSFEADVFRAYQGIQSHLNRVDAGFCYFYGLRIDRDSELSWALRWTVSEAFKLRRRKAAPSWSWLGWHDLLGHEAEGPHYFIESFQMSPPWVYSSRFCSMAGLSLVYKDGTVFPWEGMTKEWILDLIDHGGEESVRYLLADAWTFTLDKVFEPGSTTATRPFVELEAHERRAAAVGFAGQARRFKATAQQYGLTPGMLVDDTRVLFVVLGSIWQAESGTSTFESFRPQLYAMAVASSDGGETWERLDVLRGTCRRDFEDHDPASFGWKKRQLKIY